MKQITREAVRSFLPQRPANGHKGTFGRVLVVAGSRTMCGAGFLCAKSALLAGAGLVYWALPQSMQPAFAAALPEVITWPMPQTPQGEMAEEGFEFLQKQIEQVRPSVLVIGPGMGKSPLLEPLLWNTQLPLVIDADALNALSKCRGWSSQWPQKRCCIFTPHPGEMARLLGEETVTDEPSRLGQVQTLCAQTRGVCLLKGAGTLVAVSQEGGCEVWQNTTGGPALAKAGSGDVLSGLIAGLWAQLGQAQGWNVESAKKAALCGVYLHGLAGDLAALKRTDYSVLARHTAESIAQAFAEVLQ